MARPSFKIDPVRLRSLRVESQYTQLNIAKKVHSILLKSNEVADSSVLSAYQRIERTGRTSKKTAHALAQVLGVSIEIIQGKGMPEDSTDIIVQIRQQLLDQRDSKNNLILAEALIQHAATYDSPPDDETCLMDFAEDVAKQIELTQIGQDTNKIARLVELTGWTKPQLQELSGIVGHWLLLTRSSVAHKTDVIQGVDNVMYSIKDNFKDHKSLHLSDARITFSRSLPWLHLEITQPRYSRYRCKFSFVRCKPNVDGLKWINPSWRDEFWLDNLKDWAFSNTNFFTDVDGKNYPEDLRQLRLRVVERNTESGIRQVAYSKGRLEELPEDILQRLKEEGSSHYIVTCWLSSGLAQGLAPHLCSFPREDWEIRANTRQISIHLKMPENVLSTNKELVSGNKFTINLVEETSSGIYRPVPWSESSVKAVVSELEEKVFQKYDEFDHEYVLQFNELPHDNTDKEPSTEEK